MEIILAEVRAASHLGTPQPEDLLGRAGDEVAQYVRAGVGHIQAPGVVREAWLDGVTQT